LNLDIGGYQFVLFIYPAGVVTVHDRESAAFGPAFSIENGSIVEPLNGRWQAVNPIAGLLAHSTANTGGQIN
jgi:hypothetical protein